jgi:MFS family permease
MPIHTRWLVLFLSSFLMLGNYYAYDLPASLNTPLQHYLGQEDAPYQYTINLLYSVYSFPNIFLPLISGFLIDHYGGAKMGIFLSSLQVLGQCVFAYGVQSKSFFLMYSGRAMYGSISYYASFGVGGESLFVAQTRMTTRWFRCYSHY